MPAEWEELSHGKSLCGNSYSSSSQALATCTMVSILQPFWGTHLPTFFLGGGGRKGQSARTWSCAALNGASTEEHPIGPRPTGLPSI